MKIFAPDRSTAVTDYLNYEQLKDCPKGNSFRFVASMHEYYIVQLVALSDFDIGKVKITTESLHSLSGEKDVERAVTCLNTEKIMPNGEKTVSDISLHAGVLQPLFFGINFKRAKMGEYYTVVAIGEEKVRLQFKVTDELVFLSGTFDKNRLSRLGWLNSTKYLDKRPLKTFEEISVSKNVVKLTGKELTFGNDGFIEQVDFYFDKSNGLSDEVETRLFSRPMDFVLEGQKFKYNKVKIHSRAQTALIHADGKSRDARIDVEALVRYEGAVDYTVKITAENNFISTYADLVLAFNEAEYAMGLGMDGGKFKDFEYSWDNATASDSVFVGQVNAGAILKLYEKEAPLPPRGMYNKKFKAVPESTWANYKRGSVKLTDGENEKSVIASAGQQVLMQGEELTFRFRLLFTPFKPLNLRYGLGMRPAETDVFQSTAETIAKADDCALQYIALPRHRSGNPYRNYPFDEYKALEKLTLSAHKHKIGLAIEYDSQTISAYAPETGAFASMGNELIYRKRGEGIPVNWIAGAIITEDVPISGRNERDVSYLLVPGSRMDNFFVEGVEFLTKQVKVDGILLSDTSMQRDTAERAAKCIERNRGANGMLELGFSDRYDAANGYLSAPLAYADVLPFIGRVYVETPFDFSDPIKNIFEHSGMAFGLGGDTSSENSVLGSLLYGMLPRYGKEFATSFATKDIQKVFRDFDISTAKLRGFWDPKNPVKVDNAAVLCTSYMNGDNMIAVLYNTSNRDLTFEVGVENKLGYTTVGKKVVAPQIEGIQKRKRVNFGKPMKLKANSGILITVIK